MLHGRLGTRLSSMVGETVFVLIHKTGVRASLPVLRACSCPRATQAVHRQLLLLIIAMFAAVDNCNVQSALGLRTPHSAHQFFPVSFPYSADAAARA